MALKAMLTVDLNADDKQRKIFNEKMASQNWVKLKDLSTVWSATFTEGSSKTAAFQTTQLHVEASAGAAKIKSYSVAVHFGTSNPIQFAVI